MNKYFINNYIYFFVLNTILSVNPYNTLMQSSTKAHSVDFSFWVDTSSDMLSRRQRPLKWKRLTNTVNTTHRRQQSFLVNSIDSILLNNPWTLPLHGQYDWQSRLYCQFYWPCVVSLTHAGRDVTPWSRFTTHYPEFYRIYFQYLKFLFLNLLYFCLISITLIR